MSTSPSVIIFQKYSLDEIIHFFYKKFGQIVNENLILKSLVYFEDIEEQQLIMKTHITFEEVKIFLEKLVKTENQKNLKN